MNVDGLLAVLIGLGFGLAAISCLSDSESVRIWTAVIFIVGLPGWYLLDSRLLARSHGGVAGRKPKGLFATVWLAFAITLLVLARSAVAP